MSAGSSAKRPRSASGNTTSSSKRQCTLPISTHGSTHPSSSTGLLPSKTQNNKITAPGFSKTPPLSNTTAGRPLLSVSSSSTTVPPIAPGFSKIQPLSNTTAGTVVGSLSALPSGSALHPSSAPGFSKTSTLSNTTAGRPLLSVSSSSTTVPPIAPGFSKIHPLSNTTAGTVVGSVSALPSGSTLHPSAPGFSSGGVSSHGLPTNTTGLSGDGSTGNPLYKTKRSSTGYNPLKSAPSHLRAVLATNPVSASSTIICPQAAAPSNAGSLLTPANTPKKASIGPVRRDTSSSPTPKSKKDNPPAGQPRVSLSGDDSDVEFISEAPIPRGSVGHAIHSIHAYFRRVGIAKADGNCGYHSLAAGLDAIGIPYRPNPPADRSMRSSPPRAASAYVHLRAMMAGYLETNRSFYMSPTYRSKLPTHGTPPKPMGYAAIHKSIKSAATLESKTNWFMIPFSCQLFADCFNINLLVLPIGITSPMWEIYYPRTVRSPEQSLLNVKRHIIGISFLDGHASPLIFRDTINNAKFRTLLVNGIQDRNGYRNESYFVRVVG